MKQYRKAKKTLFLLGIGSGVLVAALLCMLLFFYHSYQTSLASESRNHLLEVSSQTASSLDNILAGNHQLLQTVEAALFAESKHFDGNMEPLLNQMGVLSETLGDSGDFFLLNEAYLAYMSDGTYRSFSLVEDIRKLTETGEDFAFLSVESDGQGRLYMVNPIKDTLSVNEDRILGLGAYFDISSISFLLNQNLFGAPVSCYLLDDSGALIYQSNEARGKSSMQPFYYIQQFGSFENTTYDEIFDKMMVQQENGVASYMLDGQDFYITYNNLSTTPWVLAVSYEKNVVNSSMNRFSNSFLLLCVIVFTCIVLILLVMSLLTYRNAKFAYQRALSEQERHLSELAEQVYDNQISVDLETMQFKHYRFREQSYLPLADSGDFTSVTQVFAQLLTPSDYEVFEKLFAPALLRHEYTSSEEKKRPQSIVVYLEGEGHWIQLTRYLHREQGRSFATIMSTDITEEMELKKQLNQKNIELAQANAAKSLFLANMSHDIRTPMNAIVGMTRIASANVGDPARIQDCLEKIDFSSHHLLSLINDVLDMSKIESGKLEINHVDFDLSEQIASITSIIATQAKDRSQEFDVLIHNIQHEKLIGDPLRFSQVLINILGNAVKFTPISGHITLEVTELPMKNADETRFRITISDTGIGMSEEFLPHLFDAFTQESAGNRHAKGTGLGMAISSNLVNLMGGSIAVESELEKGTCFTIELPFHLSMVPDYYERLPELRVLFVDDNPETCMETTRILEDMGLCVQYALSGAQAVHMAEVAHRNNEDYQLAIIDWIMPNMDGIETAVRIRQAVCCDLPIIMLSAYDWSEVKQEAYAAGIEEFMSKPLFMGTLYKKLAEWNQRRTIANQSALEPTKFLPAKPLSGHRFLLVDDNELNRTIACELLMMRGADVEEAVDGAQALEAFIAHPVNYYDVILMDIQMPVMNGYEATAAIRTLNRPDAAHILILAVTANAFSEDIKRAQQAGMNAHVAKPIDFDQLETLLEKLFKEKDQAK